jgi:hypothetical protein
LSMNIHGSFNRHVHGDATNLVNGCHGEDVGKGIGVEPYVPKTFHGPHLGGRLSTTICMHAESLEARSMLERRVRFLKTETVDWLSSKIQIEGIMLCPAPACVKRKSSLWLPTWRKENSLTSVFLAGSVDHTVYCTPSYDSLGQAEE